MLRIIDGIVFEGKAAEGLYNVALHDLGHGHREAVVQPVIHWQELHRLDPLSIAAQELRGEREADPEEAKERERLNRLRAARRARTKVRRLCKAMGLDTLLTLTYRRNQRDLALCKRHFEAFRKRMWRLFGERGADWHFVAAFERQERGAVHIHIATRALPEAFNRAGVKVKSYNVIRALWRACTGEWGGTANVSGSKGRGFRRRSPARMASYLSKYMLKDWETWDSGTRRFQASQAELSPPERVQLAAESFADLVAMVYAFAADGDCEIIGTRIGAEKDSFFLASEGSG